MIDIFDVTVTATAQQRSRRELDVIVKINAIPSCGAYLSGWHYCGDWSRSSIYQCERCIAKGEFACALFRVITLGMY